MLLALFVVCAFRPAFGYAKGVPLSACKEMVPRHRRGPTISHHHFQARALRIFCRTVTRIAIIDPLRLRQLVVGVLRLYGS